jgi:hypothetical protein
MRIMRWTASLAFFVVPALADLLVIPNAQTSTLANDRSGSLAGSIPSLDTQDIWVSSQFASAGGSLLITGFAFRLKPGTGSINATASSFSVDLSTTSFNPSTMSTTFAANRGTDYTQVDSGTGTLWSSPGCTGLVTCPFDMVFNLTTPFLYDPSKGNFLIEMHGTGYNGVGTGQFDVENYFSAAGSKVGELVNFVAGSPTGHLEFSDNVTQIRYTLVTPEPGSYSLLLCAVGGLVVLGKRWRP